MSTWTRKLRASVAGLSIAMAVASALPASADELKAVPEKKSSKQENIGALSGLAIGAAAGGPFGAVIGAATGAWLGDRYHRQSVAKAELGQNLEASKAEAAHLAQVLAQTKEIRSSVSFRTNDSSLATQDLAALQTLAGIAQNMPDVTIRIAGYADPRGSASYNLALSQRRADAVAAALTKAGVASERLFVEAHGAQEAECDKDDLDGDALERRVTVSLERAQGAPDAQEKQANSAAPAVPQLARADAT
ncbi:MAG TPA: OmpA family protein [Steroidobacteraceae bacterium]|nr:OmpA family protein [Steroidobacteraceae bacterium]